MVSVRVARETKGGPLYGHVRLRDRTNLATHKLWERIYARYNGLNVGILVLLLDLQARASLGKVSLFFWVMGGLIPPGRRACRGRVVVGVSVRNLGY